MNTSQRIMTAISEMSTEETNGVNDYWKLLRLAAETYLDPKHPITVVKADNAKLTIKLPNVKGNVDLIPTDPQKVEFQYKKTKYWVPNTYYVDGVDKQLGNLMLESAAESLPSGLLRGFKLKFGDGKFTLQGSDRKITMEFSASSVDWTKSELKVRRILEVDRNYEVNEVVKTSLKNLNKFIVQQLEDMLTTLEAVAGPAEVTNRIDAIVKSIKGKADLRTAIGGTYPEWVLSSDPTPYFKGKIISATVKIVHNTKNGKLSTETIDPDRGPDRRYMDLSKSSDLDIKKAILSAASNWVTL